MVNLFAIIIVILGTFAGAAASLFLKRGAKKFNLNILELLQNKPLLIGLGLFIISALPYVYALSLEKLSIVYPLTSLTYIWVAFFSAKILGEKINKRKWAGIILIMLGIFLITYFAV